MIPPGQSYPLQIASGPYTYLLRTGLVLVEGQQFQAGIVSGDGVVYTFIVNGGHDITNKIVAAAGQTCTGVPAFQAPEGCEIFDPSAQIKYVSRGWNGGAPTNGLDSPSEGMITATNFLGWTALQPASGSGGGGSTPPGAVDGGTWV